MKSLANHKFYVGMTADPRRRRQRHLSKRKDLYAAGHDWQILSQHESIDEAAQAEAQAILRLNSLHPHGNNRRLGGLTGRHLHLSAQQFTPEKGVFPQAVLDQMAVTTMRDVATLGEQAIYARRRKFWKRQRAGLTPLPGTEHFLHEPEHPHKERPSPLLGVKKSEAHCKAIKAAWARRKKEGRGNLHRIGKTISQEVKDKIAAAHVKFSTQRGHRYTYKRVLEASAKAKKRAALGLAPIPGTEFFIDLQTGPAKGVYLPQAARREFRERMVEQANAAMTNYARGAGWI